MPKKEKIEKMFDDIAPSYDRLNHLMSLGIDNIWRKKAIKEIVDGTQQQILDAIALRKTLPRVQSTLYGDGNAGVRIAEVLRTAELTYSKKLMY